MNHILFCFHSRRYGQYTINQEGSTKVPERPPFDRSSSQDSLDESMEAYWTELENIKRSNENRQEGQEAIVVKEPDGNVYVNKICLYQ
jgi:hypothetical protein